MFFIFPLVYIHTMNHPSEWARFSDENTGKFRYKHKGSCLVRDAFMAIHKAFTGTAKTAANKAAKVFAEKAGQRVGEIAGSFTAEKGSKRIRNILWKRKSQMSPDARQKLGNIL